MSKICDFPFPASIFTMLKRYGPRNLRRLAEISNNSEVYEILRNQADVEDTNLYRMGYDTPPIHFTIRELSDYNSSTELVLFESLNGGIDSPIVTGTMSAVRKDGQKQRILLAAVNSMGCDCEISSNLKSPKLMTKDDYNILRRNRHLVPYFMSKNSPIYSGYSVFDNKIDIKGKELVSEPNRNNNPKLSNSPKYQTGYYYIGGLDWYPEPIFVRGKVILDEDDNENLLIKLEKTFDTRKDGIINVRSDSRRWVSEHLLSTLKNDNAFLESWINYQDRITDTMVRKDRAMLLEFFSKEDFCTALAKTTPN